MVTGQVLDGNPATTVHAAKHVVKTGKTRRKGPTKPANCSTAFT
jgi:hypothetical protein